MALRIQNTSGPKPQLKEKVIQIYESFFKVSIILSIVVTKQFNNSQSLNTNIINNRQYSLIL